MWFPALRPLFRFTDHDVIAIGARHSTANQKQILRFSHLNDLEILRGAAHLPHVTGHAHPAHNGAGEQTLTDSARSPMPTLRTVSGITTAEGVTSDDTLKSPALGNADGVHVITRGKKRRPDHFTRLHFF